MSEFEIHNDRFSVVVSEHAAEIHSFKDISKDLEYMWQGDPAFWKGRNPTLFPMVGSTWNKEVVIDGNIYHMGNHGFTRNSDFTAVKVTDSQIVMELKSSDETLAQYPFEFVLTNTYTLNGNTLNVKSEVKNCNDRTMPFNHGWHPAFNCPVHKDGKWEDITLKCNKPQTFAVNGETVTTDVIPLEKELLAATIVVNNPTSTEYTLSDGKDGIKVTAKGYPWVAFWSPRAPFICIEPWHSHGDFEKADVPFEQREGTLLLEPGQTWSTEYDITIL